ncbi:MAG: UDP-N-acetylmuramate dehydrogenase [Gammaproteobacteria bacterium]|nr:UDP-N-acetylmuramate dehydrogenase [Gammaproteobacteria bacterium]
MSSGQVPNTLRVECIADDIRCVRDENDLAEQLVHADMHQIPATIVGGGSNLVLRTRLPGVALLLKLRGIAFERLGEDDWRIVAAAGEDWQTVVDGALQRGIGGLENLTLIPGSVGAAPVQNIGAYGRELSEFLESVTVFDRQHRCYSTLTGVQCAFGYRESVFKRDALNRYVITRLALRVGGTALVTNYPDVARELADHGGGVDRKTVADAVAKVRRRKLPDPARIGNVGSFFKNPVVTEAELDGIRAVVDIDDYPAPSGTAGRKIPAARLIDAAGWKGVRKDRVQVWSRQPLVLVNLGGATGGDVLDLATVIRDDVYRKYGVALELEPAVLGSD